ARAQLGDKPDWLVTVDGTSLDALFETLVEGNFQNKKRCSQVDERVPEGCAYCPRIGTVAQAVSFEQRGRNHRHGCNDCKARAQQAPDGNKVGRVASARIGKLI
ncbi:MAG TPA: hypothetical protein VF146_16815, partial [Bryobacteraceae bacterium]